MKKIVWYVETTASVPFDELVVYDTDGMSLKPAELGWTPEDTAKKLTDGEVSVSLAENVAYTDDTNHWQFEVEGE